MLRPSRSRDTGLAARWTLAKEANQFSQILSDGGEQEFVLRASQAAQSQAAEVEDAFEMRETPLDLLAQTR